MNFLIVMWGIFIGVIVTGIAYDLYIVKIKKSVDKRVARLFDESMLDFIKKMADADKYVVGPLTIRGGSSLNDALIVCSDVDTAITLNGNYIAISSVNLHNFKTGVEAS